jgi:hypothetical protein
MLSKTKLKKAVRTFVRAMETRAISRTALASINHQNVGLGHDISVAGALRKKR